MEGHRGSKAEQGGARWSKGKVEQGGARTDLERDECQAM